MIKKFYFIVIFTQILFLPGLILAQSPTVPPENSLPETAESFQTSPADLIHFGDELEVDVIGSLEYDWRGKLNPAGFLEGLPNLEEPVYGLCRSPREVAEEITKSYQKFLRDPQIEVRILDRSDRPTSVLYGAVKQQQRFRITRPILLNELLIVSGGLTDQASGEIQIFRPANLSCREPEKKATATVPADFDTRDGFTPTRQDNGSRYINITISDLLTGREEANPQILSGDIITVLAAQPIYVIGGVENPKQISSRTQMTLTRAVSSAGGLSKDADESRIIIFRRENNETRVIEADLVKIKAQQSEDITLKPYDIVEVPTRGARSQRTPPVLENLETTGKNDSDLPLRIID